MRCEDPLTVNHVAGNVAPVNKTVTYGTDTNIPGASPNALLLGADWRLPTRTEWTNVIASGGWTNWNGPWNSALKLHAAGYLTFYDGSLSYRGSRGRYRSSTRSDSSWLLLGLYIGSCFVGYDVRLAALLVVV